jgi:hypothetical protein
MGRAACRWHAARARLFADCAGKSVAGLAAGPDDAPAGGWVIVSMEDDWYSVFVPAVRGKKPVHRAA